MLQSIDTASQTKERPRAILGRLQVSAPPPAKYIPEYDGQSVAIFCFSYGEWSANGDYLQLPGNKTKVNRSQSFSDTGASLTRNVLLPPDPR